MHLRDGFDDIVGADAFDDVFGAFVVRGVLFDDFFGAGIVEVDAFFLEFLVELFLVLRNFGFGLLLGLASAVIAGVEAGLIAIGADAEVGLGAHGGGDEGRLAGRAEDGVVGHARWTIGAAGAISVDPDIVVVVALLTDEDVGHVVDEFKSWVAAEYLLDRPGDVVRDDGAVGVGEVGAGIPGCHIELAIDALAVKRDERLRLAEV